MLPLFLVIFLVFGIFITPGDSNKIVEKAISQVRSAFNWALSIHEDVPIEEDVLFYLHTKYQDNPTLIEVKNITDIKKSKFNPHLKTIFIIHGWTDHKDRDIIVNLRNELLKKLSVNVFVVDWKRLAGQLYFHAASSTQVVGKHLAKFITSLIKETNINPRSLHFIGHSLGAQISGTAGYYLKGKVGQITGLDPAGPMFEFVYVKKPNLWLNKRCAKFVDIIHSASEDFGVSEPIGHADFYPNDGIAPQPGCTNPLFAVSCSHVRSMEYYTESLNTKKGFIAMPCKSWLAREMGECKTGQSTKMGYFVSQNANGSYFLQTNSKSPFALGLDGV